MRLEDILTEDLYVVFCGINPGLLAAAGIRQEVDQVGGCKRTRSAALKSGFCPIPAGAIWRSNQAPLVTVYRRLYLATCETMIDSRSGMGFI